MARDRFEAVYEELPPTSNKLYFKGTMLTKVARIYAEKFSDAMRPYLHIASEMDPNALYAVHLTFFFHELVNSTWNNVDVAPSRRAKERYKKIDLTNRIKLLEDCVRDFLGIDDSHTFAASQEKHQCGPGEKERVHILVERVSPRLFGL